MFADGRLDADANTFLVVDTRGHHDDLEALQAALATGAGYVGLWRQPRKKGLLSKKLAKAGFAEETIRKRWTPVGLPIGAATPEEIAVSIPPNGSSTGGNRIMSVTALLLAAGASTRMGRPKLLLPLQGKPVIARLLEVLAASTVSGTVVVVREEDGELRAFLAGRDITVAVNPEPGSDMAHSMRLGLERVGRDADGVLVLPADYPLITPAVIDAVCARFAAAPDRIVIPVHNGRRGHPPVFPGTLLAGLTPGRTLRDLIMDEPGRVLACDVDDDAVLRGMDTPADYFEIRLALACKAAGQMSTATVCRNG